MSLSAAVNTLTNAGTSLVSDLAGPCIFATSCRKAVIPPKERVLLYILIALHRKAMR